MMAVAQRVARLCEHAHGASRVTGASLRLTVEGFIELMPDLLDEALRPALEAAFPGSRALELWGCFATMLDVLHFLVRSSTQGQPTETGQLTCFRSR